MQVCVDRTANRFLRLLAMRSTHSLLYRGAICLIFCTTCCTNINSSLRTVHVPISLKSSASFFDLFTKVDIIPLDDDCLVSNGLYSDPTYWTMDNECFYILDDTKYNIVVFNQKGRFVASYPKRGNGHGEYSLAYGIYTNEMSDVLSVLDPRGKIYHYSIKDSLSFINATNLSGTLAAHSLFLSPQDTIILSFTDDEHLKLYNADHIVNLDAPNSFRLSNHYFAPQPFFCNRDSIFCYDGETGTIYSIETSPPVVHPIYSWDFGRHTFRIKNRNFNTPKEFRKYIESGANDTVFPFLNMIYIEDTIFADVVFHNKEHTLVYNIDTGKSFFFSEMKEGVRFKTSISKKDTLYTLIEPTHLQEFVNEKILDNENKRIMTRLQSSGHSNPVILKYTRRTNFK